MKKFLLVMITFAFISGSFANDLSKSVVKNDVKSKIENCEIIRVLNSLDILKIESKPLTCSATLKNKDGESFTITASNCRTVAIMVATLY